MAADATYRAVGDYLVKVLGLGCRTIADAVSLQSAARLALSHLPDPHITAIATVQDKAQSRVFQELGMTMGVQILGISAGDLSKLTTKTHSARVYTRFGVGSLAEAAALAAVGANARLIVERVISGDGNATAAIAERAE
ncbi:MAG: cobalamin biosynthesis protein [Pseudomonadota bacterium]